MLFHWQKCFLKISFFINWNRKWTAASLSWLPLFLLSINTSPQDVFFYSLFLGTCWSEVSVSCIRIQRWLLVGAGFCSLLNCASFAVLFYFTWLQSALYNSPYSPNHTSTFSMIISPKKVLCLFITGWSYCKDWNVYISLLWPEDWLKINSCTFPPCATWHFNISEFLDV